MARRFSGNMSGERYLANANPSSREVHDLDNEMTGPQECQINEIIRAGHDRPFVSLSSARALGYDDCFYCLRESRR